MNRCHRGSKDTKPNKNIINYNWYYFRVFNIEKLFSFIHKN